MVGTGAGEHLQQTFLVIGDHNGDLPPRLGSLQLPDQVKAVLVPLLPAEDNQLDVGVGLELRSGFSPAAAGQNRVTSQHTGPFYLLQTLS